MPNAETSTPTWVLGQEADRNAPTSQHPALALHCDMLQLRVDKRAKTGASIDPALEAELIRSLRSEKVNSTQEITNPSLEYKNHTWYPRLRRQNLHSVPKGTPYSTSAIKDCLRLNVSAQGIAEVTAVIKHGAVELQLFRKGAGTSYHGD